MRVRPRTGLLLLLLGVLVASLLGWDHASGHPGQTAATTAAGQRSRPVRPAGAIRGSSSTPTSSRPSPPVTTAPPPTTTTTAVAVTTTTAVAVTTTTGPGSLPQTEVFPSTGSPQFQAEMAAMWSGVVTGSAIPAMPAFFPEAAYEQVKAIGSPQDDWTGRLVNNYRLDLVAAHALLGSDPSSAQLVTVQVPSADAHWVPAGACYNTEGYFEVPNARVVYQQDGQTKSFGIASMISWRGEWYVVHLGIVASYSSTQGVVDDPESGTGYSQPTATC